MLPTLVAYRGRFLFGFAAVLMLTMGWSAPVLAADPGPLRFSLTFAPSAYDKPFTGRVYVMLLRNEPRPLPKQLNWFNPEPTIAKDVQDWKPGTPLTIDDSALSHPVKFQDLKPGRYYVQAVLDRDLGGISFAASPGNVYSRAKPVTIDPKESGTVSIKLDQVYEAPAFEETDTVKLAELKSAKLSAFHGRPMTMRAGVILPPSFHKEPKRKFPVVYEITGFGGDHTFAPRIATRKPWDVDGVEMIWVVLDANCRLGHHVFADSANNGPVGTALVEEFIPYIEKTFRGIGTPQARFVTGHSSGGWSSLWLQVTYPKVFGGCWSTSPDPVDFRDFQQTDLYAEDANIFRDGQGQKRPIARGADAPRLFFREFSDMEVVMGRGGQLFSFEAVFSPRGEDGQPFPLYDRKTGAVNTNVAQSWKRYDIRHILESRWKELEPDLAGKIHVYMGEADTFYLEGATKLLQASMDRLKADATIELFPGKTHALVDAAMRQRMNREMAATYRKHHPDAKGS